MSARSRHVPLRRCVVCRTPLSKAGLRRLVQVDGSWRLDPDGRAGGRGTWVCGPCVASAGDRATRRAFGRAFRQQADEVLALLGPSDDAALAGPLAHDTRHGGTHG